MIDVDTVTGPARWATYLVNGDESGFDFWGTASAGGDEDPDLVKARAFERKLARNGWRLVSVADDSERYDGYQDVVDYVVHREVKR